MIDQLILTKTTASGRTITITIKPGSRCIVALQDGTVIGEDFGMAYPLAPWAGKHPGCTHMITSAKPAVVALTSQEATKLNAALKAYALAEIAEKEAQSKTLEEQRAVLVTAYYNAKTEAFAGSREWIKMNHAEKALTAFDEAHPEIFAAIEAEHTARLVEESSEVAEVVAVQVRLKADAAKASAPVLMPTLYASPSMPLAWVASDETGALWLFDARPDGWAGRRPYLGYRAALKEAPRYNAVGTGWPHHGAGIAQAH